MNRTTVAVDLAKTVFQLAVADASWKVIQTHRLTRGQFDRWFAHRPVGLVIMEACGGACWLNGWGIEVKLLPATYVRAYVRRNKTNASAAQTVPRVYSPNPNTRAQTQPPAAGVASANKIICRFRRAPFDC